jgi:transposase InsO family protein
MALHRRRPPPGLLHHSDRGCQYASAEYRSLLHPHGLEASMSRTGNPSDNAWVESFFSTLKTECLHRHSPATRQETQAPAFDYIETFYNRRRIHSALGYQSPVDFEKTNH